MSAPKTYIVIALSVGGLGNKIFKSGDEVKENNFYEGHADKLVDQGFLKLKEEKKEDSQSKDDNPKKSGIFKKK